MFYTLWGAPDGLKSPLTPASVEAFLDFIPTMPPESLLAFGVAVMAAVGMAFFLGSASDEELSRRARENRR